MNSMLNKLAALIGLFPAATHQTGCLVSARRSLFIRVVVGVTLLTVVLASIDVRQLVDSLAGIDTGLAALICLVSICERMLMARKWNLLLRGRGIQISMWQAIRLYFVGHLLGGLTPGGIGGDVFRVTALSGFRKTDAVVSTIVLERIIGFAVLGGVTAITLPITIQYLKVGSITLVWTIVGWTGMVIVTLLLSLRPSFVRVVARSIPYLPRTRIGKRFAELYHVYAESRFHVRLLVIFTLLTVLQVVIQVYMGYLAAKSLNIDVSFGYMLCVMPLGYALMRLPISIQGIGVLEGSFSYLLVTGGFSAEAGVSIALLLRAVGVIGSYVPAAVLWWLGPTLIDSSYKIPETSS